MSGLIISTVISIVLLLTILYTLKTLKQPKYYKDIIDSSLDIILIYKNSELIDVNRAFFHYFDKYTSLKEFLDKNDSISNFFEEEKGYLHPLTLDGGSWFDYIKQVKVAEVKIKIEKKEYYFSINVSLLENNITSLILKDISELVKSKQEIKNLTLVDNETNIGNRRYCDKKIRQEVAIAQRYKYNFSIIMVEIDNFKELQELHGEVLMSKVQVTYVKLIVSHLREIDIYCRFSANKFIIMLPSTNLSSARKVAQKLQESVFSSQKILSITMSFGVTTYVAGEEIALFLNKADRALTSAKESGINKIVIG